MNYWIIAMILVSILCLCIIFMNNYKETKNKKKKQLSKKDLGTISKNMGMSYNISDGPEIMKTIKSKSIEDISNYADIVCKNNAQNDDFLKQHFNDFDQTYKFMSGELENNPSSNLLNPTTIGNAAYISIHSPDPYKTNSKKIFDLLITHLK